MERRRRSLLTPPTTAFWGGPPRPPGPRPRAPSAGGGAPPPAGGGDRPQPHGAAAELLDDRPQDLVVDLVQAEVVDVEAAQRLARGFAGDDAGRHHLRVVAGAGQG